MMMIGFPYDWYWLADDKRVFASARQVIVTDTDPAYLAWIAIPGNLATPWPYDAAGNQTEAALQVVLAPYNLFVNPIYYAADARYRRASGGLTVTSINTVPFLTDPVARNTLANANEYAKATPHDTDWKFADGSFKSLTPAQLATATDAMASFVQACFTCESQTITAINGGSITTHAQVDAAFAAIANVVP
jgi:Domain of unknown function (DUF4376)